MTEYAIRFNVIGEFIGHINYTLMIDGQSELTVGANVIDSIGKEHQSLSGRLSSEIDGRVVIEDMMLSGVNPYISVMVPVTEQQYFEIEQYTQSIIGWEYNYSLFTKACVDLADEIYAMTGHPGDVGDLFLPTDQPDHPTYNALIWSKLGGIPLLPSSGSPAYIPEGPILDHISVAPYPPFGEVDVPGPVETFSSHLWRLLENDEITLQEVHDLYRSAGDELRGEILEAIRLSKHSCFTAGTRIALWGGKDRRIEEISCGDCVVSYGSDGELVPGVVTDVMSREVDVVIDFHGVGVTPGHLFLCGRGSREGQHIPLMDIIRDDGVVVRMDGTEVRAATNCEIGSEGDRMVWAVAGCFHDDGNFQVKDVGQLRYGTRMKMKTGEDLSIMELVITNGGKLLESGCINFPGDESNLPFIWPFTERLPRPEDYVLQRSAVSFELSDVATAS